MELSITVTQDDIDNAFVRDYKRCPIALALLKAIPNCYSTIVDNYSGLPDGQDEEGWEAIIQVNDERVWGKRRTLPKIYLPKEAGRFANDFDKGIEVKQFSFVVNL